MTGNDMQPGGRITMPGDAVSAHTRTALTARFTIKVASIRPDGTDAAEATGAPLGDLLQRRGVR